MSLLQLLKKFSTESEITHWVKINEGLSKKRKKKSAWSIRRGRKADTKKREKFGTKF